MVGKWWQDVEKSYVARGIKVMDVKVIYGQDGLCGRK